jgi:hypothetical protein
LTGFPGLPGLPGSASSARQYIVIHHLESSSKGKCPEDSRLIRSSLSVYGYREDLGSTFHTTDLGYVESCPPVGSKTFKLCSPGFALDHKTLESCSHSLKDFTTIYLSSKDAVSNVTNHRQSRSHCSVCEIHSNIKVIHSYSEVVPVCSEDETRLWSGHSFRSFNYLTPQALSSTGSCLPHAMESLMISCDSNDVCRQDPGISSWLSSIEGERPSRCSVCRSN